MKKNLIVALGLGIVAAVLYFASMAGYAFPGESAHLQALWRGLDTADSVPYPLMSVFAKMLGGGNLIAPVCGALSVILVFLLMSFFVQARIHGEATEDQAASIGRLAGLVAGVVFMCTPAVYEAATHLEPRLFDTFWALLIFAVMIPYSRATAPVGPLFAMLIGAMTAFGMCDSALFVALAPLILFGIVAAERSRDKRPFVSLTLFAVAFLVSLLVALRLFGLELTPVLKGSWKGLMGYFSDGWVFVVTFATIPFVVFLFSSESAYNEKPSLVQWLFHIAMTVLAVLAVATPLSPSSLLRVSGVLPVATSLFAAAVCGYLISFWWLYRRSPVGISAGVVFAFVLTFSTLWNAFAFEKDRGAFADKVAHKVIADLGDRKWFVTDGVLDDHLRIVAADEGRELNLIALSRDLDQAYLVELGNLVRDKGVGGSKNEALSLSLTLGVLPFVQDWFASDPSVEKDVAIWGAPDIWYSAGLKPVPEFFFFGADRTREPDVSQWKEFGALLEAPKGWGSYRGLADVDPVERMRLGLRRHVGMVANNRGVYLQDLKKDDAAFDLYELVLGEIDNDNVCALFNEIEMVSQNYARALAKKRELDRRLKAIVDDKDRRYVIWRLGSYYGYIRNPDMFVRLGFSWARSGRPGDALAQIRRAIDFVPTDKQTALLNMMAALYANENDQKKSRKIYESILAKNERDHDALIGLMRLELLDGDQKKALEYLERAVAVSPAEGARAQIELSMVSMMKNDLSGAQELLRKVTESEPKDLQAWSFLAAVTMQRWDASKDEKEKAALLKDIANRILPEMEKQATNPYDYYVQTTKAFLLMRQGEEKRRDARDAFVRAAQARPGSVAMQDIVLGLDISLDDKTSAERHAREVLRKNRNAPLANYVMGSLAIQKAQYAQAEAFLRTAADAPQPNVLALNDLAEVLRRTKKFDEAERYARKAIEKGPKLYVAWETLGVIFLDQERSLEDAEANIRKAIDLSKEGANGKEDFRLYTSLARAQVMRGDMKGARMSVRKVQSHLDELTEFERREFEEIRQSVK